MKKNETTGSHWFVACIAYIPSCVHNAVKFISICSLLTVGREFDQVGDSAGPASPAADGVLPLLWVFELIFSVGKEVWCAWSLSFGIITSHGKVSIRHLIKRNWVTYVYIVGMGVAIAPLMITAFKLPLVYMSPAGFTLGLLL